MIIAARKGDAREHLGSNYVNIPKNLRMTSWLLRDRHCRKVTVITLETILIVSKLVCLRLRIYVIQSPCQIPHQRVKVESIVYWISP